MPTLILPEAGQHLVFAGATGSGKTYLAETMLQHQDSYFAIDTQDGMTLPGAKRIENPKNLKLALFLWKKIHYVPKPEWIDREVFDYIFRTLLESSTKKKPHERVIYVDEVYHVGYGVNFPPWLPKAITTARQRKLSFWISTQRPAQIPIPVISEASRMFVYMLTRPEDMKRVAGYARKDPKGFYLELEQQEKDHSFIEIDLTKGTWEKYPPLKR